MGFRFRRSVRILPGVRLNLGTGGVSTSIGPRGASVNVGKRGIRANVGLPGTGLSYSTQLGGKRPQAVARQANSSAGGCAAVAIIVALLAAIGTCSSDSNSTQAASAAGSGKVAYIAASAANCRMVPDSAATIVTKLARGSQANVLGTGDGWTKIEAGAAICWVSTPLLSDVKPLDPVKPAPDPSSLSSSESLELYAGAADASRHQSRPRASSHRSSSSSRSRSHKRFYEDAGCPCSGDRVCIGPRGGRYCITSGGNKRYGV